MVVWCLLLLEICSCVGRLNEAMQRGAQSDWSLVNPCVWGVALRVLLFGKLLTASLAKRATLSRSNHHVLYLDTQRVHTASWPLSALCSLLWANPRPNRNRKAQGATCPQPAATDHSVIHNTHSAPPTPPSNPADQGLCSRQYSSVSTLALLLPTAQTRNSQPCGTGHPPHPSCSWFPPAASAAAGRQQQATVTSDRSPSPTLPHPVQATSPSGLASDTFSFAPAANPSTTAPATYRTHLDDSRAGGGAPGVQG